MTQIYARVSLCLAVILLGSGCSGRSLYMHLPVSSAVLVHACAAVEVQKKLFGDQEAIDEVELSLGRESKNGASLDTGYEDYVSVKVEGSRGSNKSIKLKISKSAIKNLTLKACTDRGYIEQLGPNGCLLGAKGGCAAATTNVPPPPSP